MWKSGIWVLLLWWGFTSLVIGQKLKPLQVLSDPLDTIAAMAELHHIQFTERGQVSAILNRWVDSLHQLGYFECHTGEVVESDTRFSVEWTRGKRYTYTKFDYSHVPTEYILRSGFDRFILGKSELTVLECKTALKKIANYLDDIGYPYAKVYLDSTIISASKLVSRLNVDHGPRIYIDTIEWDDKIKVSAALMRRLVQVKPGMYFSNRIMVDIQDRLSQHKFIEMSTAPQVIMYKNKAVIKLFAKDRKVSSLDALLGLLPGSGDHPGLKLNGTFNGNFVNQFRQGESLRINYQSLQSNSQSLSLDMSIPYLLSLPFNPFAHFSLYKRDSLYLDVKTEFGASWKLGKYGSFKAVLGTLSSSLLKPDLAYIQTSRTLPAALDFNSKYFGASIGFKNLDLEQNPKSGYTFQASIHGSSRNIKANQAITSLKNERDSGFLFSTLYDGLLKNGFAVEWGLQAAKFTSTGRLTTWYSGLQSGFKNASQGLRVNELYRLGGYQILRGFDEQSILAKNYIIWVNEFRLITGAVSYIHVHSDLSSIEAFNRVGYDRNFYWSLGAGMVFDTALGLLSISSSVGRKLPDPFDLRVVKLHVGYVSNF